MSFIADNQIPFGDFQFFLKSFTSRQLIKATNCEIHFLKDIPTHSGLHTVRSKDFKAKVKFLMEFVLPLLYKTARRDNQASFQIAPRNEFLNEQPCHDCFSRAGVIRQDVAEGQTGQHLSIHSRNLVRQRLHRGNMDCEIRVKQMGKTDSIRFGRQTHLFSVRVKAPRQAIALNGDIAFIFSIKHLRAKSAFVRFIRYFDNIGAVPIYRNNFNGFISDNSKRYAAYCDFFEFSHPLTFFKPH